MRKSIAIAALALLSCLGFAQTIKVQAPNLVAVGENFNVTFVVEGESKPSDFQWSQGSDFQKVWGPQQGSSTSISIVNGKTTKSCTYTYTYILMANSVGRFTIPSAKATVKGNVISSSATVVEVVSNGQSQQGGSQSQSGTQSQSQSQGGQTAVQGGDQDIFMKLYLSKTHVVVGEPITATLKLYQRVDIAGFDDAKFPSFDGFWSQDLTPQGDIQFVRENLNDRIYNAAVIRKYVLIPQKAGQIIIDPAELMCRIYVRTQSRGGSIFDSFFDDGYTTVRKRVSTPAVKVNVSNLPAGAPASFKGGVGTFNIKASVSKDSLLTHEAASLYVTISGKGNVSLLDAPKVSFPADFEVYDPKTKESTDKSTGGTSGSKTYEYVFIPRSHGEFKIDPIEYSYYDINTNRYVRLQTDTLTVKVGKGRESDAVVNPGVSLPTVNKKGVANLNEDVRFITLKKPSLESKGHFFLGSAAFWIVFALLFVLAGALYLAFRKLAARKADVAGAKNRKATKMALRRLRVAEGYLKSNVYGAFYEELHKALLGFVSDKLNMPASELSKDNIARSLAEAGVTEDLVSQLVEVIDACEFARYAPASDNAAMKAHFDQAASVISSIDPAMKTKKHAPKSALVIAALLMLSATGLHAQETDYVDTLWNRATAAYTEGNWSAAADSYIAISDLGLEAPELYCNIGDAFFKQGETAKAILWYERALKLDPSFADARHNLEVCSASVQDDIDSVPEFFLKTWMRKLSFRLDSNAWAWAFLCMIALALGMLLLFLLGFSRTGRIVGFFGGIAALVLSLFALSFSIHQKTEYVKADSAIVMRPVVPVKSSPSNDGSADLFILHEGTKVGIKDNVADWTNVVLSDGREGWLRSDSIEII